MNTALVDHLVCPRCGPPHGLLLLAHEVREGRVREGVFGCPNCRDRFPVSGGFGDLRPPPRVDGDAGGAAGDGGEDGDRASDAAGSRSGRGLQIAAALGVTRGPGLIVVTDAHRAEAVRLAQLVEGIEVLVVGWGARGLVADGVSAFVAGPRLPLRDGAARGVVAAGRGGEAGWAEGRRVLAAGGRIAITEATREAREWVRAAGLATILDENGMVVGAVPVPGGGPAATPMTGP